MFFKILWRIKNGKKLLEYSSFKAMNNTAKTDIKLNVIIFEFHWFLKTKTEVNWIIGKNI